MMQGLIMFRLYDSTYGPEGNKKSLYVSLRNQKELRYSFYGGWQDSDVGFAISNLQLKTSLPLTTNGCNTVMHLVKKIKEVLATGVGSRHVKSFEIVNDFPVSKLTLLEEALEGVLHHNEATKKEFQLPKSLIKQIKNALDE